MSEINFENILKELNRKLSEEFDNFVGTYFYGSRVRGDSAPESDYDVIMIFAEELSYEREKDLAAIIGEFEYKYDIFIDYHPYTTEALRRNPVFYSEVAEKGVYYEAA